MNQKEACFRPFVIGLFLIVCLPFGLHAEQVWKQAEQEFVMSRGPDGQIHCRSVSPDEAQVLFGGSLAVDPDQRQIAAQTEIGNVTVNFMGGFPANAQTALLRAVEIVLQSVSITVPIDIDAIWQPLAGNTLGRGGALLITGPASPNVWSPEALISQINGSPIFPDDADLRLTMDSSEADWYFGIDGNPPGNQFDFVTIALHEIIHGFGFGDSFFVDGNMGNYGLTESSSPNIPILFDTFVQNGGGTKLTDTNTFPKPSEALGTALVGDVFFGGTEATAANGGTAPPLFAPDPFQDGSSIAHWDNTFDGGPNALMTPSVAPGEANHSAGPLTDALLQDLGYQEGSQTIYFPVFANGNNLSSNMTGFNTSSTSALTATVRFFNQAGDEIDSGTFITSAGASVAAQGLGVERNLNPLGSFSLETSGQGGLVFGSATITANGVIDGVLRFDLPGFGVAGVGASEPLSAAIVPVRRNSSISTGVAIRNTSSVPITIEAELKDENGNVVANGTVTLPELPVDGQMQAFIQEPLFFPNASTSNFRGTLCLRSSDGTFAVVALEQGPSRFTTLPVSRIQ